MKLERVTTLIWGCLFAFLLSLSAGGCLVSAFSLTVDMGQLALCCACAAVITKSVAAKASSEIK